MTCVCLCKNATILIHYFMVIKKTRLIYTSMKTTSQKTTHKSSSNEKESKQE
jgi:hypothetical protein